MQARSYETTLAYIDALNRKPRAISLLQRTVRLLTAISDGIRLAHAYDKMTLQGVPPRDAIRRVFEIRGK